MNRLIFIHGRSQQDRLQPDILNEWTDAWNLGLAAGGLALTDVVDIALPFYGDTLDDMSRLPRAAVTGDELAFKRQILEEMAAARGITPATIARTYRVTRPPRPRGPLNWEWVQAILRALDEKTGFGDDMLDRFTHDVYVYLKQPPVRRAVDALVAAAFKPGRSVVVGHSLGSVVGYNVLRAIDKDVDVVRYVTVGSPLGIRAIQGLLVQPLEMPACVRDWYNAMDERDVVALRPLDAATFPVRPPIRNKTSVKNKTKNRHGISGYLDDRDVAKEIFSALPS
jgi:hypothetical protein